MILSSYARDDHCVALLRSLESGAFTDSGIQLSAHFHAWLHRYSIDQGLLSYRTNVEDMSNIVVPYHEELTYIIRYETHDTALSSHLSR